MANIVSNKKALAVALGQIQQFGKGLSCVCEDRSTNVETIPTGSLSLDVA